MSNSFPPFQPCELGLGDPSEPAGHCRDSESTVAKVRHGLVMSRRCLKNCNEFAESLCLEPNLPR